MVAITLPSLVFLVSALVVQGSPISGEPSNELVKRLDTAKHCGQYDVVAVGPYSLLTNLWGINGATGSQCSQLISQNGNAVSWTTTFNWQGGNGVKSYANIQQNQNLNRQLSAIKSIPSTWKWAMARTGTIVANVAYDLFTSNTPGGANVHEIMIWLGNYGAGPLSYNYNAQGNPVPIAKGIQIAGLTWDLYNGSNGANIVWSFLPSAGNYGTFNGDVNLFLKYLTSNSKIASSQYLKTAQGGTEPTQGAGTLTSSGYSLVINV